jgi:hypothetical protein
LEGTTALGVEQLDETGSAQFTVATANLGSGTLPITASYAGDGTFLSSTSPELDQVVEGSGPTLTPTLVQLNGVPPSAGVGASVTLFASVIGSPGGPVPPGPPTGTVTFSIGGGVGGTAGGPAGGTVIGTVPLDLNGDASLSTSSLPIGQDFITAVYSGDADYAESTGFGVETIGTVTTTTLASSAVSANDGDPVTFTVNVSASDESSGVPTGSVEFLEEPTPSGKGGGLVMPLVLGTITLDVNGDASLITSALPVGSDDVVAVYQPADGLSYVSSSSNVITEIINALSG